MKKIIPEIYIQEAQKGVRFYQQVFGGEIKNMQISDNLEMFRHLKGKVIHSELHLRNRCILYFVDALEPQRSQVGNITVMLHMESEQELRGAFRHLALGGEVGMKPQRTLLGGLHAIVTDRFGAPWALHCTDSV